MFIKLLLLLQNSKMPRKKNHSLKTKLRVEKFEPLLEMHLGFSSFLQLEIQEI